MISATLKVQQNRHRINLFQTSPFDITITNQQCHQCYDQLLCHLQVLQVYISINVLPL